MLNVSATERTAGLTRKVVAALSYALASTLIMLVNKSVFTTFRFRSFLAIAIVQYATTLVILALQHRWGLVVLPRPTWGALGAMFPLAVAFCGNTLSGLGATQKLTMPLFVLLRRFSIVITMVLETVLLARTFAPPTMAAVGLMVLGALVAAVGDSGGDMAGVALILTNDVFTALQGVVLRQRLDRFGQTFGSAGVMFLSNALSLPLTLAALGMIPREMEAIRTFGGWSDPWFVVAVAASAGMGFVVNLTYYHCTKYNSPLTTAVVGAGKNIVTSYAGMFFKDYAFTLRSFVGINISVVGSLWYNGLEWRRMVAIAVEQTRDAKDDEERGERRSEGRAGGRAGYV